MTLIVLGWDGLDYDLVERWGMADDFGPKNTRLDTFDNPVIGKPHTYEVWPSIITGRSPDEHGIHADDYTQGGSWENPLLNVATVVSKYTVPDNLRWAVGRRIRDRGARFEFERLEYYRENDIWTVFDDRESFPLAIPNARSKYDDELGIATDRGAALAEYMDIQTGENGKTVHKPRVSARAMATRLEADVGQKLGAVRQAIQWDFDLIFVWLGYLDTVGHIAPTMDDPEAWQRAGYETAAEWTRHIIETAREPGDIVCCVSDHGLKDGTHTHAAYFGWWGQYRSLMPETVLDVSKMIHHLSPRSDGREEPHRRSESVTDHDTVNERLRDLGYLD